MARLMGTGSRDHRLTPISDSVPMMHGTPALNSRGMRGGPSMHERMAASVGIPLGGGRTGGKPSASGRAGSQYNLPRPTANKPSTLGTSTFGYVNTARPTSNMPRGLGGRSR